MAGMAAIGFLAPALTGATYLAAAGSTAAARAAFGRQTLALGRELAYLVPLPLRPDTAGGYVWWKGLAYLPLVFALWGVLAAVGAVRGDEDRGVTESWLATPISRSHLLLARFGAFSAAAAAVVLVTALGSWVGVEAGHGTVGVVALTEQALALWAFGLVCFGVGALAAQDAATSGGASALAAAVLVPLYLVDVAGRLATGSHPWALISPFNLVDLTTAVVPGGRFAGPATAALGILAAGLALGAALAFRARDARGTLVGHRWRAAAAVSRAPGRIWQVPVLRGLRERRWQTAAWVAGTAAGAAGIVSLTRGVARLLAGSPLGKAYLAAAGHGNPALLIVSEVWFGIAALVAAAYAITLVSSWATADRNGRLEAELSAPVARWRVGVERAAELALGSALLAAAGGLTVAAVAPGQGATISPLWLTAASGLLVPVSLTFGALGALAVAVAPRQAVGALGLVAAISYYLPTLGAALRWPPWTEDISVLHLYGAPLTSGVDWSGLLAMALVTGLGLTASAWLLQRRDLGG